MHSRLGIMIYWKLHVAISSVHQISSPTFDTMTIEHKLQTLKQVR